MTRCAEETFDRAEFDRLAAEFRYVITDMICRAGSGHLGGALSLVEIVISLYWRFMRVDPANPLWPDRDRLVMSKGHAGPVLYIALAYQGFFSRCLLGTMNENGTMLPSHVDRIRTPGVDMTAGSLGQGLSAAIGMALAARMDGRKHDLYCIIGDGESNEGQVWEAAMFAGHHKLDNLIAICDYNKLQIDGFTDEVLTLEPLRDKWAAFNWHVLEMDGHDWDDIHDKIQQARAVTGKPTMIIAHTIKAKGNAVCENRVESHNIKAANQADYDKYIGGLEFAECELPY
jgi:transketolase